MRLDFIDTISHTKYMPEDILHEPPTHAIWLDPARINTLKEIEKPQDIHWDKMQDQIGKFVAELKRKYSDLPEYQLELIGDLYGGGYRLERYAEFQDGQDEQKETAARIQHNQAHAILYSAHGASSHEYQKEIHKRVELFDSISKSETGKAELFDAFWNGVRSEAATLSVLDSLGYRVFLPDYTQDPYEVAWENNEVLQWDVKSGVDMVALRKDNIAFLIDSKGNRVVKDDDGRVMQRATAEVIVGASFKKDGGLQMHRLPPILRNFVSSLKPTDIRRVKIILPTDSSNFVDNPTSNGDKEFLQNFIKPKGYIRDEIAEKLGHRKPSAVPHK